MDGEAVRGVWVERRRWPDRQTSRVAGIRLGHDADGTWIGLPPDHPVYRGDELLVTGPRAVVMCVPDGGWWVASWFEHSVELFVDVTTPAHWTAPDVLVVVDLDLGVISQKGSARVVDVERFDEQRLLYEYPSSVEAAARRSADEVLAAVAEGRAPFTAEAARGWFAVLRAVVDR